MRGSCDSTRSTEPAVIGAAERDLDLDLRMQPELQHRRGKHHRDVDADRVHPALGQRDVAVLAAVGLLDLAQRIARDAAAHILVADAARHHAVALGAGQARAHGELLQHRVFHVFEDLVERLQLVVVRVDVDDREVPVAALARLLRGVGEQLGGVEFLDRHAAEIGQRQVHHTFPLRMVFSENRLPLFGIMRVPPRLATCPVRTPAGSPP